MDSHQLILQGIQKLKLTATDSQIEQLCEFNDFLIETNKIHNLTGHRELEKSAIFNILNAVAAFETIQNLNLNEIADIGSGAGLPGIPWAILVPQAQFYLIESTKKKADFIASAVAKFELSNVKVINQNVFEVKRKFKTMVFQAFGKFDKVKKAANYLISSKGTVILFASSVEEIELGLHSESINKFEVKPFKIPFAEDVKRNLVIFEVRKGFAV